MRLSIAVFMLFLFSCSSHVHWGYQGEIAPENWAKLHKDYQACSSGQYQTPINLVKASSDIQDDDIEFNYQKSPALLINDGHTIQFNLEQKNTISINGKVFELKQFHFHHQSEHTLNGRMYPGELHLVHVSEEGHLAVVGFFLEYRLSGEVVETFFSKVPVEGSSVKDENIDLQKIIEQQEAHYFYQGSLTTPPCTEGVQWVVFDRPLPVDKADFMNFVKLYPKTNRNVQALKRHKVYHTP